MGKVALYYIIWGFVLGKRRDSGTV